MGFSQLHKKADTMTAQPDITGFGRPPAAPSGIRKLTPFFATLATGGAIAALAIYFAQLGFPERFTPGYVIGKTAGSETLGHLQTSGDEQISYDVRSQAAQQALGLTTQAMQGAAAIANTADVVCGASHIGENFAAKQRPIWNERNSSAQWWQDVLHDLGQASCGVGAQVRTTIIGEVASNGRQSGSMNVRDAQPARPQLIPVRTLADAFAIQQPSRPYTQAEFYEAFAYVDKLDLATRNRLNDAYNGSDQSRDIYVERVRAVASLNIR
jgi:hypothetical protein